MNQIAAQTHRIETRPTEGSRASVTFGSTEMLLDFTGTAFLPKESALIVSDLHFEKASSYGRKGMFLPPYDSHKTLALLKVAIDIYKPRHVISLGDSVHDEDGWNRLDSHCMSMLEQLMAGREWTWISGNHDPQKPAHFPGNSAKTMVIGDLLLRHEPNVPDLFDHCDETAPDSQKLIEVCGHLHPAARISRRGKSIRRRCFASDGSRLVMPAFGVLTGGLCLTDPAFDRVLDLRKTTAYMIGRDRLYPVSGAKLSR